MALPIVPARAAVASAPVQPTSSAPRFGEVLRASAAAPRQAAPSAALRTLESVERAQRRLDEVLAQARSGRTFTGAELLALQAEAHRFSHTVELASKVVEQGAQTIKQAVNTPV